MVKVETPEADELQKEFDKVPERKVGQWKLICEKIEKSGKGVVVTYLTRGQCWALKRAAKEAGLRAKVVEKGSKVLILPPEK